MSEPTYKEGDLIHVPGNAFKVQRVLGSGGMGSVYWVIEKQLDEPRVLKILHPALARQRPDIVERFLREARAMTKVKHPNIARVLGLYTLSDAHGAPAYTMEALDGVSVADAVGQGIEAPHRALNVLLQTLAGLDAMHRRGLVHRDIKPHNVLLYKEEGRNEWLIKILDFGVIRIIADEKSFEGFVGTFAYASDRMLSGKVAEPVDDVWAAFLVLYELLTGTYPFAEYGMAKDRALARIGKRPRSLRDHGLDYPDIDALLDRALSIDEKERFQDAFSAIKAVKPIHAAYAARMHEPAKVVTTTSDSRPSPEQITMGHLSPTRPEQMPSWLVELRGSIAAGNPAIIRLTHSDVDERGPTTPGPRRAPTVDERAGSTLRTAWKPEEVPTPSEVDVRQLPTALPSSTPPLPPAAEGDIEYVASSRPAPGERPRTNGPKILMVIHREKDYAYEVRSEYPLVIGREPPADVILDHPAVSVRHARVDHDADELSLVDLGSTNGTFVQQGGARKRLQENTAIPLADEDVVYFGHCKVRVFLGTKRSDQEIERLVHRLLRLNARGSEDKRAPSRLWGLVLIGAALAALAISAIVLGMK